MTNSADRIFLCANPEPHPATYWGPGFRNACALLPIAPIDFDLSQNFLHHSAGDGILIWIFEQHLPGTDSAVSGNQP